MGYLVLGIFVGFYLGWLALYAYIKWSLGDLNPINEHRDDMTTWLSDFDTIENEIEETGFGAGHIGCVDFTRSYMVNMLAVRVENLMGKVKPFPRI